MKVLDIFTAFSLFLPLMSNDTRTFTIFIIARLFSSYILLGHFEWSGFERKLGDFQTFSEMLANVWFSSETFPERCGSGGHGEIEKLIRAVLFPLSYRVTRSKRKKNIRVSDIVTRLLTLTKMFMLNSPCKKFELTRATIWTENIVAITTRKDSP